MDPDRAAGAALQQEIALITSANDQEFAVAPSVRLLTLEEGAVRVKRSNERVKTDELWQGEAFDPYQPESEPVPVYVRIGQSNALVAELLCSVVARSLGLPAPEPFVILIEPNRLQGDSPFVRGPKQRQLYVGTRDIGGNTFAQLLREDSEMATWLLSRWEHLVPVTALDEWLANPDRNMGNILYVAQTLHIIDHAEAFGGSARTLFPLADLTHDSLANKLGNMLTAYNANGRQSALTQAKEWLTFTAGALDIEAAVAMADIRRWQTEQEEEELVHFITTRLLITHKLLCNRLGHPQLGLSA